MAKRKKITATRTFKLLLLFLLLICLIIGCSEEDAPITPDNLPPLSPYNPLPMDGYHYIPITTSLSWQCEDPDVDSLTYDIYFGSYAFPEPPLQVTGHTNLFWSPETLDYERRYYWRIIASDPHGAQVMGPLWIFTTEELEEP